MQLFKTVDLVPFDETTHLTLGTFDGVHLGHQKIIRALVQSAESRKERSLVVTFESHPQRVVQNRKTEIKLLTPLEEKIEILDRLGVDGTVALPFTEELSRTAPESFIRNILVQKIGIREFVAGYNHAFGRRREGGVNLLKKLGETFGFSVNVISPVSLGKEVISSTRIRRLVSEGNVREANHFLGWNYSIFGVVKKGNGVGSELGFPTANLDLLDGSKLVPGDGVYAVWVRMDGKQIPASANIGTSPTIKGKKWEIEIHIHNFTGDLYQKTLEIIFIDRIRNEIKFDTIEDLVNQIKSDNKISLELLAKSS